MKQLERGEASLTDLKKNLEYAASVLESVYIEETRWENWSSRHRDKIWLASFMGNNSTGLTKARLWKMDDSLVWQLTHAERPGLIPTIWSLIGSTILLLELELSTKITGILLLTSTSQYWTFKILMWQEKEKKNLISLAMSAQASIVKVWDHTRWKYATSWVQVQNLCYASGLWNYISLLSSRSRQIRASDGMTTPGWRMINSIPCSAMIITMMRMLFLGHNVYSVRRVETGRLCSWSPVHVNTTA